MGKTMFRNKSLKIGLLTLLGALALILSLSAFTTMPASAATAEIAAPARAPARAQVQAYGLGQVRNSTAIVEVIGSNFGNGNVSLSATINGRSVSLQPNMTRTNRNGSFQTQVRIRVNGRGTQRLTLYADGHNGQAHTQVNLR